MINWSSGPQSAAVTFGPFTGTDIIGSFESKSKKKKKTGFQLKKQQAKTNRLTVSNSPQWLMQVLGNKTGVLNIALLQNQTAPFRSQKI